MSVQASANLKGGFDMVNSKKLDDLIPVVHSKALQWLKECDKQGHDVLVTSTYRDFESQNALYAQGRTKPGKKVTNAKAGQSFHNYGVAIDFVPIINGKPDWNNIDNFKKIADIAKKFGFEWAGDWKGRFIEYAHIQYTNGLNLSDFQAGRLPK